MKHIDFRIGANYYTVKKPIEWMVSIDGNNGPIDIHELELTTGLRKVLLDKRFSPYLGIDFCFAYIVDNSEILGDYFSVDQYFCQYGFNFNLGFQFKIRKNVIFNIESSLMYYDNTSSYNLRRELYFIPIGSCTVNYKF